MTREQMIDEAVRRVRKRRQMAVQEWWWVDPDSRKEICVEFFRIVEAQEWAKFVMRQTFAFSGVDLKTMPYLD